MKISREFKIGLFALIVIAITYWGINFLKGVDVLSSNATYYAYYDKSDNIEISSPVLIRGIKVGTVTNVDIDDVDSRVKLTMTVLKKYKIPVDTEAQIGDKSLLGGKAVILFVGKSGEYVASHGEIKGTIDDNMSKQIDEAKATLISVVDRLKTTLDGVNGLLDQENVKNLSQTFENLNGTTQKLDNLLAGGEINKIVKNLENLTSDLNEVSPALKSTVMNLDSISSSINHSDLESTILAARSTISELDKSLKQINSGEGSIGALMFDKSLYQNLDSATENLSSLLYDMKDNPKRYVHFSLFGRKEK